MTDARTTVGKHGVTYIIKDARKSFKKKGLHETNTDPFEKTKKNNRRPKVNFIICATILLYTFNCTRANKIRLTHVNHFKFEYCS